MRSLVLLHVLHVQLELTLVLLEQRLRLVVVNAQQGRMHLLVQPVVLTVLQGNILRQDHLYVLHVLQAHIQVVCEPPLLQVVVSVLQELILVLQLLLVKHHNLGLFL